MKYHIYVFSYVNGGSEPVMLTSSKNIFLLMFKRTSNPTAAAVNEPFPETWMNGADCATEAKVQIHKYNDDLFRDRPNTQIIEMTQQPGIDYPFEAKAHRNERELQLKMYHLEQLINWLPHATSPVKKKVFDDFILYPTD